MEYINEETETRTTLKERVGGRVVYYSNQAYAGTVLFLLSFAESSFFPIPPDFLLVPLVMTGAKKWWEYATITTVASVLGGIAAYAIGFFAFETFGERIVSFYHLEDELILVRSWYDAYAFWIIFIAGFTFIPYKIFTLTAGLFEINFLAFVVASLIGRGARFFILAFLIDRYSAFLKDKIYRYFNSISVILIVGIALALYLLRV